MITPHVIAQERRFSPPESAGRRSVGVPFPLVVLRVPHQSPTQGAPLRGDPGLWSLTPLAYSLARWGIIDGRNRSSSECSWIRKNSAGRAPRTPEFLRIQLRFCGLSIPCEEHRLRPFQLRDGYFNMRQMMRNLTLLVLTCGCSCLFSGSSRGEGYSPRVGQPHPDFCLPSIADRSPVSLSQFRGRKVLLVHFGSW